MISSKGKVLLVSAVILGVASGCSIAPEGTEDDSSSVNSSSEESGGAGASPAQPEPVDPADDDPLNVTANGGKLCSQQPPTGSSFVTILVHNATDQTFTLGEVKLGSPQQLTLQSALASPASREGHHSTGDQASDTGAEESEAPAPVEPLPTAGYEVQTHDYVNVLVEVSIDENTDSGTAAYLELDYSSADRDYAARHPLEIELTREGCS